MTPAEEKALKIRVAMIEKRQARIYETLGLNDEDLERMKLDEALEHMSKTGDSSMIKAYCREKIKKTQ